MRVPLPLVKGAGFAALQTLLRSTTTVVDVMPPLSRLVPPLAQGHRRVVLVRHGETDWNNRGLMQGGGFDIELNAAGQQQAQLCSEALRDLNLGVVASSHLARSEATADAIAATQQPCVRVVDHRLGEMRFGDFEGLAIRGPESSEETRTRFEAHWEKLRADRNLPWPNGESISQVEQRALAGIRQLLHDFPQHEQVCVVAHGRTNRIALAAILQQSEDEIGRQGNTGINVLDWDPVKDKWTARVINYTDHLDSYWG